MAQAPTRKRKADAGPLDERDWIKAGLTVLATDGVDAVRVEPLAKTLHVTKGSFYWHFRDRGALLDAMLTDWRRGAFTRILQRVEQPDEPPLERLKRLIHFPVSGGSPARGVSLELAIRLWGKRDQKAQAAVEEVDEHRLTYIASLLSGPGVADERARAHAFLVYAYMLAEVFVQGADTAELAPMSEDMLLSLTK